MNKVRAEWELKLRLGVGPLTVVTDCGRWLGMATFWDTLQCFM